MQLFAAILLLTCAPAALIDFAIPKWKTDKHTRIEDTYKYLHQATRGGEHAVPSKDAAKKWLDNEWQGLGVALKNEATWEHLCPDGSIGRLNLRPFKDSGGKPDDLRDAFLQSAREYKTESSKFTDAWAELGKRLKKRGFDNITYKEWKRLDGEMKKKEYPAIHHSEEYKKAYRPAYRVLTLERAQLLLPS